MTDHPSREAEMSLAPATCPHCGASLVDGNPSDGVGREGVIPIVVEGTAARGLARAVRSGPLAARSLLPTLPAAIWRPAVRAAAEAGVGALTLTVGARLLRAWLARPRALPGATPSALAALTDLLSPPRTTQAPRAPRERGGLRERGAELEETVIYLRRTVRPR